MVWLNFTLFWEIISRLLDNENNLWMQPSLKLVFSLGLFSIRRELYVLLPEADILTEKKKKKTLEALQGFASTAAGAGGGGSGRRFEPDAVRGCNFVFFLPCNSNLPLLNAPLFSCEGVGFSFYNPTRWHDEGNDNPIHNIMVEAYGVTWGDAAAKETKTRRPQRSRSEVD